MFSWTAAAITHLSLTCVELKICNTYRYEFWDVDFKCCLYLLYIIKIDVGFVIKYYLELDQKYILRHVLQKCGAMENVLIAQVSPSTNIPFELPLLFFYPFCALSASVSMQFVLGKFCEFKRGRMARKNFRVRKVSEGNKFRVTNIFQHL